MQPDDRLKYWREALAAKQGNGRWPRLAPDEIHEGYFRIRNADNNWEPISFQTEDDYWVCLRNGVPQPTARIAGLFMRACRAPVTEEAYDKALAGHGWEDEPAAAIGHNLPPDMDPHDRLEIEWAGEREMADEMLGKPIATQAEADRLAIWTDRVQALNRAAKAEHDVEKRPVLEAAKRITLRWSPLLDGTEALYKKGKAHALPWLLELDRLETERQATARRDAEKLRAVASKMAESAQDQEAFEEAGAAVAAARDAELDAEFRNPQAGRTGAKVSLRTFVAALIVDYDKALAAVKDRPQIQALVQQFANAAAKHGDPLAGTKRVVSRKAV